MPVAIDGSWHAERIVFDGDTLDGFGKKIRANSIVRNEVNEWRRPWEIVRTFGSTEPNGLAYQPRSFPKGIWEVTRVVMMADTTPYWPVYIDTDATQDLKVWEIKDGFYHKATGQIVQGRGYGLHHARYQVSGQWLNSGTTLGCVNIHEPDDAMWLGEKIKEAFGYRVHVYIEAV